MSGQALFAIMAWLNISVARHSMRLLYQWGDAWRALIYLTMWSLICILFFVIRNFPYAILAATVAALYAHTAWVLWRRRRKRRPSRVLGRVVNLGHRLAVAPVPVKVSHA